MREYVLQLVLAAVILVGGCASGRVNNQESVKITPGLAQLEKDGVEVSQIHSATIGGNSYCLLAKVGDVFLVYSSPQKIGADEIMIFARMAGRIKHPKFQEWLKSGIQRDIPLENQGGDIVRNANLAFWQYFSPSGTMYCMVADTKDLQSLQASRWTKMPASGSDQLLGDFLSFKKEVEKAKKPVQ